MFPGAGVMAAKLALRWSRGTMIPRQFGPTIRMPSNFRCSSRMASSILRPASPASRKPAERMMMPGMPFSPQDRTMPGTWQRGTDHGQIGNGGNAVAYPDRLGLLAPLCTWD